MRKLKRRRRSVPSMPEISLTPLIDTALTLLIIFMITAPMMHNAIKVDLPSGKAKEDANVQQDLIVYVDSKGTLFFNGVPYNENILIAQLKQAVGKAESKVVYVKGDRAVNYGTVLELVDKIKVVGGIKYVALATKGGLSGIFSYYDYLLHVRSYTC